MPSPSPTASPPSSIDRAAESGPPGHGRRAPFDASREQDLLHAWQAGDHRAGALLCRRQRTWLRRRFRRLPPDVAEDLVQETLLAFIKARDALRHGRALRGYLHTVARRMLAQHLTRCEAPVVELDMEQLDRIEGHQIRVCRIDVLSLLHTQAAEEAQTIIDYYLREERAPEIAERRGVPVDTVRRELRRGMARLRRSITAP